MYALLKKKFKRRVLYRCVDPTEWILGDFRMRVNVKYTNTSVYWLHSSKLVFPNYEWYNSDVVFLLIITDSMSHCNILIRDGDVFYRFEPHGSGSNIGILYNDYKLDSLLGEEISKHDLVFTKKSFSALSFQSFQNINPSANNNHYCIWWCFFFICNIVVNNKGLRDIQRKEFMYIKKNKNILTEKINKFINYNMKSMFSKKIKIL